MATGRAPEGWLKKEEWEPGRAGEGKDQNETVVRSRADFNRWRMGPPQVEHLRGLRLVSFFGFDLDQRILEMPGRLGGGLILDDQMVVPGRIQGFENFFQVQGATRQWDQLGGAFRSLAVVMDEQPDGEKPQFKEAVPGGQLHLF